MKKLFAPLLLLCVLFSTALAEESCDNVGHAWADTRFTPATCTEGGEYVRTCTRCGAEEITSFVPLGHAPENLPGIPPTETSEGLTAGVRCAACGAILQAQEPIPRLETPSPTNAASEITAAPAREPAETAIPVSSTPADEPPIVYFTPVPEPARSDEPPIVYFTPAPEPAGTAEPPAAYFTSAPEPEKTAEEAVPSAPESVRGAGSGNGQPSSASVVESFLEIVLLPENKSTSLVLLISAAEGETDCLLRLWLVTADGIAMELAPGRCEVLMDGDALTADPRFASLEEPVLMPEAAEDQWMSGSVIRYNGQPALILADAFFRLRLPPETLETVNAYLGDTTILKCLVGRAESGGI